MAEQKPNKKTSGKRGGRTKSIEGVRSGVPPMMRSGQAGGSKKASGNKNATKPKVKEGLRDGAPKARKR